MKLILFIGFIFCIDLTYQEGWTYDNEKYWPGMCTSGRQQSPINIVTHDAVVDIYQAHIRGPLQFKGYERVHVTGINNGHTLKWTLSEEENGPAPTVSGGPLRGSYSFLQVHLHWLSEHAINGYKYPLELHLVHVKTGLTIDEAVTRPDGLAVIGVLCHVENSEESKLTLEQLMPDVPELMHVTTDSPTNVSEIDLTRLFSPVIQSYYTYAGSLTTPNCYEVVTWIVMDKSLAVSDEHFRVISRADVGGMINYRSLQPTNRVVYRSVPSCANMLIPGLLSITTNAFFLISCLASTLTKSVKKLLCPIANIKKRLLGYPLENCTALVPYLNN